LEGGGISCKKEEAKKKKVSVWRRCVCVVMQATVWFSQFYSVLSNAKKLSYVWKNRW